MVQPKPRQGSSSSVGLRLAADCSTSFLTAALGRLAGSPHSHSAPHGISQQLRLIFLQNNLRDFAFPHTKVVPQSHQHSIFQTLLFQKVIWMSSRSGHNTRLFEFQTAHVFKSISKVSCKANRSIFELLPKGLYSLIYFCCDFKFVLTLIKIFWNVNNSFKIILSFFIWLHLASRVLIF